MVIMVLKNGGEAMLLFKYLGLPLRHIMPGLFNTSFFPLQNWNKYTSTEKNIDGMCLNVCVYFNPEKS